MKANVWLCIFLTVCCAGGGSKANAGAASLQSERVQASSAEVLQLAEEVGRWLADNAIRGPQGISWPDDTLKPENVGYDLGSGVAGKAAPAA